jgi:hypothetical protein
MIGLPILPHKRRYTRKSRPSSDNQPFVFLWYQNLARGISKAVTGFQVRMDEVMIFDEVSVKR